MKKRKVLIAIAAYIGLILVCALIVYVVPSIKGMLVRTYIAEQGEINLSDEVDAYIVRNETVYVASKATSVTRIAEAGKLVKAHTSAVSLSGTGLEEETGKFTQVKKTLGDAAKATESGTTEVPGYVCYKVDGAEGKLAPRAMEEISQEDIEDLGNAKALNTAKGKCAKGDPVFKVVNNGRWYMVFFVSNKDAEKYTEGYTVRVKIDGEEIKAKIKSVIKGKTNTRIILKCGVSYDGFLTDRKIDTTVTTASASGLVIEKGSIIKKDGKQGVLVKNKLGNYIFKRVSVKASDGEKCVVYQDIFMDEESNFVETISIYDEIVASPSEGDIKNAE